MKRYSWMALVLALGVGAVARADGPTLHEYIPDVREDEGAVLMRAGSAEPAGIVYDGEVLPPPTQGPLQQNEQAMAAGPGDGVSQEEPGRRSPTFRPDRVTEMIGTVGYYEAFNPAIAPFKRVTALDAVAIGPDGIPVLGVGNVARREIQAEGALAAAPDSRMRDQFWGSVVLDFSEGTVVPFPSVSPESRILTIRTEPAAPIRIEKDGADNFVAVAYGPLAESQVRVIWLTDAPRTYFATELPETPSDALAAEVFPLPPPLAANARQFATEIGLRRGMSVRAALEGLTAHFRSFVESDDPPADTGDIYLDLARGRKGVCRHRAYAFVITAHALGIPARFVQNEAHAWVEVKTPSVGWMRIDLGGAAHGLEAHGADDRPVYRPAEPDRLPRPQAYEDAYAEARRNARGMREPEQMPGAGAGTGTGNAGPGRGNGAGGAAGGPGSPAPPGEPGQTGEPGAAAGSETVQATMNPAPERRPLAISVDAQSYQVFRGHDLDVSGRVRGGESEGVAGLRVEVLLRAADREILLGVTVTREHGWFHGSFGVPPDVPVGDHRLLVRTPGNDQWQPASVR